jgi:hypothetical protein
MTEGANPQIVVFTVFQVQTTGEGSGEAFWITDRQEGLRKASQNMAAPRPTEWAPLFIVLLPLEYFRSRRDKAVRLFSLTRLRRFFFARCHLLRLARLFEGLCFFQRGLHALCRRYEVISELLDEAPRQPADTDFPPVT